MSHYDEGVLHAMLDGEIDSTELKSIQRHLTECAECRARLAECRALRTEAFDLIETLETPEVMVAEAATPRFARLASPMPAAPAPAPTVTPPTVTPTAPIAGSITPARQKAPRRWPLVVAWAATVVLAAGLGYQGAANKLARSNALGLDRQEPAPIVANDRASDSNTAPEESTDKIQANPAAPITSGFRRDGPQRKPATSTPAAPSQPPAALRELDQLKQRVEVLETKEEARPAPKAAAASVELQAGAKDSFGVARALGKTTRVRGVSAARRFDSSKIKLEDVVVTGTAEQAERKKLNANAVADERNRISLRQSQTDSPPRLVTADQAIRVLGGAIRLVDGLQADHYEAIGSLVRVVYRFVWGDLVLEQYREGTELKAELSAPTAAPADSLAVWRARIK